VLPSLSDCHDNDAPQFQTLVAEYIIMGDKKPLLTFLFILIVFELPLNWYVKGVPFFYKRYMKVVSFMLK